MASRFQPAPIIKAAELLLVDIENAVRRFDRHHRYQIGKDLREKAMEVYRLADRAFHDREYQARHVAALVWSVDELKQHLQIAKLLKAFGSFGQFEAIIRLAQDVGMQSGGWRRSLKSHKVQNAPGREAVAHRDQKLSTRAASAEANP